MQSLVLVFSCVAISICDVIPFGVLVVVVFVIVLDGLVCVLVRDDVVGLGVGVRFVVVVVALVVKVLVLFVVGVVLVHTCFCCRCCQ